MNRQQTQHNIARQSSGQHLGNPIHPMHQQQPQQQVQPAEDPMLKMQQYMQGLMTNQLNEFKAAFGSLKQSTDEANQKIGSLKQSTDEANQRIVFLENR